MSGFKTLAELLSLTGMERLQLIYPGDEIGFGYDFHSLSFDRLESQEWKPIATITQKSFQGNHPRSRWVVNLHSFSPAAGTAIILVGESDSPQGAFFIRDIYSWRRWSLLKNCELATLKICKSPFEPL